MQLCALKSGQEDRSRWKLWAGWQKAVDGRLLGRWGKVWRRKMEGRAGWLAWGVRRSSEGEA